ncbi:MAG: beta-glucosidase [Candidatus Eisenbacteria bacterium]|uniref:Beta-glucosidase n=1 Tax=Eiseniibacteriota bacterium TaxID=2212470 RepID=A0A849SF44_UNCEI|nr:beta-glucosidase [Candidatus Eisenbacteria bacterium]
MWGVATSAQQIEGAFAEGGRGQSIWDRYASTPNHILDGSDSRSACDHFHRWQNDIELLEWLGVGAYRLSISWPRILPTGSGNANAAGLDFYDALIDRLLACGIQPFVTLNHWDLPQALQDQGGWTSRSMVNAFADYVAIVSRRLGDRVGHWVTHNEPWCIAHLGYQEGVHAPGLRDPGASLKVVHHLLLSHGRAIEILRGYSPGAQLGIVHLATSVHPVSDSDADRDAARQLDGAFNRWYLDPLYRDGYPEDAIADHVGLGHLANSDLPFVQSGDFEIIRTPTDFLGVNYYSRSVVKRGPTGAPLAIQVVPDHELTAMGWEVYPQGLHEVLTRIHADYRPARIYLTENGAAYDDGPSPSDSLSDPRRVDYLRTHVAAAQQSAAEGVPLHGYFVWSLMDNFEWAQGLSKRFGLFHVDFETQRRTPRESAFWYRDLISSGAVDSASRHVQTRRSP